MPLVFELMSYLPRAIDKLVLLGNISHLDTFGPYASKHISQAHGVERELLGEEGGICCGGEEIWCTKLTSSSGSGFEQVCERRVFSVWWLPCLLVPCLKP